MLPVIRIIKILARKIRKKPHIKTIIILLTITILTGTFGFSYFENESLWDSFYWTIVVITTVGFGDIYPVTFWGRIIFFLIAVMGISTITIIVGEFASYIMEGKLMELRGLKKIERKKHVIIVGWNRNTESTWKELKNRGIETLVIDNNIDAMVMREKGIPFISGDIENSETLEKAGVKNARAILIASGNDETRILIALKVKKINREIKVISLCSSRDNMDPMKDAGIDVIIPAGDIEGILLANAIEEEPVVDFVVDILEAGKGLDVNHYIVKGDSRLLNIEGKLDGKPIAIYRGNEGIINFDDNFNVKKGDIIILLKKINTKFKY